MNTGNVEVYKHGRKCLCMFFKSHTKFDIRWHSCPECHSFPFSGNVTRLTMHRHGCWLKNHEHITYLKSIIESVPRGLCSCLVSLWENNCFLPNYEREMWLLVWLFAAAIPLFLLAPFWLKMWFSAIWIWRFVLMKQSCSSGIEHWNSQYIKLKRSVCFSVRDL